MSLIAQATHCNTREYMEATQDTHAGLRSFVNLSSAFIPSRTVLPSGPQEQWEAFKRLGTRWGEPSVLVRDRRRVFWSFACFFCWGFLVEETPCEHWENMHPLQILIHRLYVLLVPHKGYGAGDMPVKAKIQFENHCTRFAATSRTYRKDWLSVLSVLRWRGCCGECNHDLFCCRSLACQPEKRSWRTAPVPHASLRSPLLIQGTPRISQRTHRSLLAAGPD